MRAHFPVLMVYNTLYIHKKLTEIHFEASSTGTSSCTAASIAAFGYCVSAYSKQVQCYLHVTGCTFYIPHSVSGVV